MLGAPALSRADPKPALHCKELVPEVKQRVQAVNSPERAPSRLSR